MRAETIRVGNVEILPLQDAAATAPCAALFPSVTKEQWEPHREHLHGDALTLSITSFLVRAGGKTMLVDTGIGNKNRPFFPNGRLPDALAEAGVRPGDVDVVLATHIHVDHVGWHTTPTDDGFVPTFLKARHVFTQAEWEYFTDPASEIPGGNQYVLDSVLPLRDRVEIDLVEVGPEHRLTDEITLLATPGHTPAHTSVAIASGGEAAMIWGDVCHHPAQVTELWSPLFDMNPTLAVATREKLLEKLERERTLVLAGHFAFPGMGRIVTVEGKRYWRAGLAG